MSKNPGLHETLVNTKTSKLKRGGKPNDQAASKVPVPCRNKQASISTSTCGRNHNLSSRKVDSVDPGTKVGGSLKRGVLGSQGYIGHQVTRQASHTARPVQHLSSSQSFSSLHTSSLTTAPFMRNSCSLSRLDQKPTRDDFNYVRRTSCQIKKGQPFERKVLDRAQRSSSEEQIRDNRDQRHGDNNVGLKTRRSSESLGSSSSGVCATASLKHSNIVKKQLRQPSWIAIDLQTKDGVHTLGAVTAGMRRNWVQAVLKSVRPSLTPDAASSSLEQKTEVQSDCAEDKQPQEEEEQPIQQHPEMEKSSAGGSSVSSSHLSSTTSPSTSTAPSPINPTQQTEGEEEASCHQCPLLVGTLPDASCVEGATSECLDEHSRMQVHDSTQREEPHVSMNSSSECKEETEERPCVMQTEQHVKELEQTQKELSRLQQLNKNLQHELQHQRTSNCPQNELLSNYNSISEQALALQRLQKINHDLLLELDALRRSQEEAREAELRRRVDILAQQAQLLVTGDATALAQAHLEQDHRRFQEQQQEWECCTASLKSQLTISEEQRKETECHLAQLQEKLQSYPDLQQEADQLRKQLQEVTAQLHASEEAQAQKEARLQKHLVLLQASQDRERKSLAASLAQAEENSQHLQGRLDRAEQHVESLNETQTWTREIEEARKQLQEELACTVSAVQRLQEEREQLGRRCQELQGQLSEADVEVSRVQNRLKTEETQYYNLEHSYERVSEELQLALGKVQQRESETQDMREGYERLLDRKEQELSEVLLKMEILGNSLEETEVKLNDVLKVCTCASSQLRDESSDNVQYFDLPTERLSEKDRGPKAVDLDMITNSANALDVVQIDDKHSPARPRSLSVDPAYQYIMTAGVDQERFLSMIQLLETKLFVTEEKLRDITQRLEEHQDHNSCQDPQLCSQLTQSRATTQHLSLLLHRQAKQSRRLAQESENQFRMLVGRFQVALNIIQTCRERLQTRQTAVDLIDFERQLATVAACLQQGQRAAEKQQRESHHASEGEDRILNEETLAGPESNSNAGSELTNVDYSEDDVVRVGKHLKRELALVEKMVSVLQGQNGISQLYLAPNEEEGDVAHRFKYIISQMISLKKTSSGSADCDSHDVFQSAIGKVCAEAELMYAALQLQQLYENQGDLQELNHDVKHQRTGLADVNPPELAPYEELHKDEYEDKKMEAEKKPLWLERLISRLQRRAKFLSHVCLTSDDDRPVCGTDENWGTDSIGDLNWMQEQAKLIYLSDRLFLDLELQQCEMLQDKLQLLHKQQDVSLMDEQEAFNRTLCELQENNSALREELERAEQKIISVEAGNKRLLQDVHKSEDYLKERTQKLEAEYQKKISELQQIHEEEMKHLHGHHTKHASNEKHDTESSSSQPDQEACSDQSVAAVEEMHRKLIGDLRQQHEKQLEQLAKEKDQLLKEETAATMTVIVAMRRAHKVELERSRRSRRIMESDDITQLHIEYQNGIQLLHKELEVLSLQHTQKCLENSQLRQELQSFMQYQKEDQEFENKPRDTEDVSHRHFSVNGKQASDFYEMEVILRAREAEMQFLRQEAHSLREELKIARMDKIHTQHKLKALYTNNQEELKLASRSASADAPGQNPEDAVTNTSSAALLKRTDKSSLTRQIRVMRSQSLKESLSVQERMKLFEPF